MPRRAYQVELVAVRPYALWLAVAAGALSRAAPFDAESASAHNDRALEHHLRRCLDDASREYDRVLELDPPREPREDEWRLLERLTPRVFVTPTEPFGLKDFAAVLHPTARLVAFHLFWDDDIDFPDDNDPCDHEVAWVRYGADGASVEAIWTYFHGRILSGGAAALEDGRRHAMRARVNVQWGKHGSLPAGWSRLRIEARADEAEADFVPVGRPVTIDRYMQGAFRKLSTVGARMAGHPLARRGRWPERFGGTWAEFVEFSRPADALALLRERRMGLVSRWNNAVINRRFLTYNFRPKTEWPPGAER
jgi:hypothetical protein